MSLPANPEAERIVCATFMAHNHLFEVYINRIKPEDFTVPVHQQIMRIGLRLLVENKPANRTTIASQITELSPTLDLSVPEYLSRLDALIKGTDQVEAYVDEVKLASIRRSVITLTETYRTKAYTADKDLVNQLSSDVTALANGGAGQSGFVHMAEFPSMPPSSPSWRRTRQASGRRATAPNGN